MNPRERETRQVLLPQRRLGEKVREARMRGLRLFEMTPSSGLRPPSPPVFAGGEGLSLWILFIILIAQPAAACTVCMGAPGDPLVEGANNGIWVLLSVIFFVQIGFIALFWTFWRRAKQLKRFREQFKVVQGGSQ